MSADERPERASGGWAPLVKRLARPWSPDGARNANVAGRRVAGPVQGFGRLWQKTYRVSCGGGCEPGDLVAVWKGEFGSFWPDGNRFYAPITGLAPGEVALLNLSMGGLPLSTGVLVLYADDESFTLMTPEGHQFAGWITFSATRDRDGSTVAQAEVLMRASDPLYELGMAFGGHRMEDKFWEATLKTLARRWDVEDGVVETRRVCVDRRRQWRRAGNIRHNAMLRTLLPRRRGPKTPL